MPYDLGDVVGLAVKVTNAANAPANAASIVLTITLPNGTTVVPTIVNPPVVTGTYVWDHLTTVPGRHTVRWISTNPSSAHTDAFDVRPLAPPLMFSLADAKKTLNIAATNTTDDDEIRDFIESVTSAVEHIVGPVVRQIKVERHQGGTHLVLRETPVISITSIVPVFPGGISYGPADVDVEPTTGEVWLLNGASFIGTVRVTFIAGREVTLANIRDAGRIILKHLWGIQNGQAGLPSMNIGAEEVTMIPGLGFAIPNRAIQLLEPNALGPKVG